MPSEWPPVTRPAYGRPPTGAGDQPSHTAEITVSSLNLHAGLDIDGVPFDVAAACGELAGDFIALQEAWHVDDRSDPLVRVAASRGARLLRADLLSAPDPRGVGIDADGVPGAWGLAVLTTLPVLDYAVADLGQARGDLMIRAAQIVTVEMAGGQALRIANTHLTHRLTSPVQLMRLVLLLARDPVPTVIVGDLNMPAPMTALAANYSPGVAGKTFPSNRPFIQLDHLLARDVRIRCGAVLPPLGSDHLPISARLRLR